MGTIQLNAYLQPMDSPIAQRQIVDGFQFDAQYERNSVDLAKIKNFSFSSGRGGTLILGGTLNGNGLLQVKDASGSVIAIANNNGIFINGASGTAYSTYLYYIKDNRYIGLEAFTRYTTAGVEVTDLQHAALDGTVGDRDTYNTSNILDANGARLAFLQHNTSYRSNAFNGAALNYSLNNVFGALSVYIDGTAGTGYMRIPRRASDPSGTVGFLYYNTTTGKFRKYDSGGWSDLA